MKVSELTDAKLDYWVGRGDDDSKEYLLSEGGGECFVRTGTITAERYSPSTDWSQGGPIIENMKPTSFYYWEPTGLWTCAWGNGPRWRTGETALIAAMRCYVASKFGDEVDDS